LQERASNHLKLLRLKALVVSIKEKAGQRPCQVRFREASASKLPLRCRNEKDDVRTGGLTILQDKPKGNLFTDWAASGIKVART